MTYVPHTQPSPGCVVLYHFRVVDHLEDQKVSLISRPAIVTSIGSADDVVNLHVFFEPDDMFDVGPPTGPFRMAVYPCDNGSPQNGCWSWPPQRRGVT